MDSPIEIQNAADADDVPEPPELGAWAEAALAAIERPGTAITVRIVDAEEGRALNRDFRGRDYATNVLSFPFPELPPEAMAELGGPYIGDLAICAEVVTREASEQGKTLHAHWAHLIVHGVLHLAGYDHQDDDEAERMETRECAILADLGFPDPYRTAPNFTDPETS
jgi:probable rRNA maturation factor